MMAPAIDNKWGGMSNGVREFKQHRYEHVTRNLKRQQLQEERLAEINLQNMLLLDKVVSIASASASASASISPLASPSPSPSPSPPPLPHPHPRPSPSPSPSR